MLGIKDGNGKAAGQVVFWSQFFSQVVTKAISFGGWKSISPQEWPTMGIPFRYSADL